ncbi:MAG: hypothetical protein V7711_08080 [Pseudomonadales bacterium]
MNTAKLIVSTLLCFSLVGCGGGGGGSTTSSNGSGSGSEQSDSTIFTISGVGNVTVDENTGYTGEVPTTSGDTPVGNLDWSLSGDDVNQFGVDAATGVISMAVKDYENPLDSNFDNVYEIILRVSDTDNHSATKAITISVKDVQESVSAPSPQACIVDESSIAGDAVYIAASGEDSASADGSISAPFRTLSFALQSLAQAQLVDRPGLTLYLREGEYLDSVTNLRVKGAAGNPVTIAAYPCENVRLTGAVALQQTKLSDWQQHYQNIYKIEVDRPVWQLFLDDQQMMPARWPNANFLPLTAANTSSVYSINVWAEGEDAPGKNGVMRNAISGVDSHAAYHNLATAKNYRGDALDASDAIIVANTASFISYSRMVKAYNDMPDFLDYANTSEPEAGIDRSVGHTPGSNVFTHEPVPGGYKGKKLSYYLEAKLDLLDQSGEWYYEEVDGRHYVYLWAPSSGVPAGNINLRDRGYAIDVGDWEYVQLKNIEYFATAVRCDPCHNITIEDSQFHFSAASRRMLKEWGDEETGYGRNQLIFLSSKSVRPDDSGLIFRNNIVRDTDVQTLILSGGGAVIDNNDFYQLDYSAADTIAPDATVMITAMSGQAAYFTNNTMDIIGTSTMFVPEGGSLHANYNNLITGGFAQNDGASFQLRKAQQFAVDISYNWAHDSAKYGIRFDAPFNTTNETSGGRFGMIHHNVVWNANGLMVKGDDHRVFHNTTWNNSNVDLRMLVETNVHYLNDRSIAANNASDSISSERGSRTDISALFLGKDSDGNPLKDSRENFNGVEVENEALDNSELLESQLNDPHNYDFRPKRSGLLHDTGALIDSPDTDSQYFADYTGEAPIPVYFERTVQGDKLDLGAYELDAPYYWIPGYKEKTASFPIPRDEQTDTDALPVAAEVSLMWREAYKAQKHNVYLADSETSLYQIEVGNLDNSAFVGAFRSGEANIANPPGPLDPGTYYWRVDAVTAEQIVRGSIWQFTVGVSN